MQAKVRAKRAHKSASRKALKREGWDEKFLKAAGARYRFMHKPRIYGKTEEQQKRIDNDNAAMLRGVSNKKNNSTKK